VLGQGLLARSVPAPGGAAGRRGIVGDGGGRAGEDNAGGRFPGGATAGGRKRHKSCRTSNQWAGNKKMGFVDLGQKIINID